LGEGNRKKREGTTPKALVQIKKRQRKRGKGNPAARKEWGPSVDHPTNVWKGGGNDLQARRGEGKR